MNRRVIRNLRIGTIWLAVYLTGCARTSSERTVDPRDSNVAQVTGSDAEMNRAMEKAKSTLDTFIADLRNPKPGQEYFSVKAKLPTATGTFEHIWVEEVSITQDTFTGKLANAPLEIPGKKLGDTVTFRRDDVSDWIIQGSTGIHGGYTVEVLRRQMERNPSK